jgi:hypothetical protein
VKKEVENLEKSLIDLEIECYSEDSISQEGSRYHNDEISSIEFERRKLSSLQMELKDLSEKLENAD